MSALLFLRPLLPYLLAVAGAAILYVAIYRSGAEQAAQTIEIQQSRQVEKAHEQGDKAAAGAARDGADKRLRSSDF